MQPRTRLGLEEGFSRRAAMWTAVGLWAAGFILAGAAAERIGHAAVSPDMANRASVYDSASVVATGAPCDGRAGDGSSTDDDSTIQAADAPAIFFPEDTLVVFTHPLPDVGVTEMQSPK